MMNKQTRKLSKIPEEVRREIEPYFVSSAPVVEEDSRKLTKLDNGTADFVRSGLSVSQSSLSDEVLLIPNLLPAADVLVPNCDDSVTYAA